MTIPLVKLSFSSIRARVEIAKMQAYKKFVTCIDHEDFYVIDLFNIFLSFVQQPVNFLIVNSNGDILVHFCNDKEHYEGFEEKARFFLDGLNGDVSSELFPFFPSLKLDYYVCPVFMQTKGQGLQEPYKFITSENVLSYCDGGEFYMEDICLDKNSSISSEKSRLINYIRVCAWLFFCDVWGGHDTQFFSNNRNLKSGVARLIKTSVLNIKGSLKFKPTPENSLKHKDILDSASFPNAFNEGEWRGHDWHQKLQATLYNTIKDRQSGLELLSGIHHEKPLYDEDNSIPKVGILRAINMIVGYRSYTRCNEDYRHNTSKGGYSYDVSYLLFPEQKNSPYIEYFRVFKQKYHAERGEKNYGSTNHGRKHFKDLLSGLKSNSQKISWYKKIADYADNLFWDKLKEDNAPEEIIKLLSSRESECIRSICDPVFFTGLVHFNNIFEYFGFDRVEGLDGLNDENVGKNISDISISGADLDSELLRLASLYYLFSGMAAWDNDADSYNPYDLTAVLIPVKVRGVVWGVGIHATYMKNASLAHKESMCDSARSWEFVNILTVSLAEHYTTLIDQALWRNTLKRVRDLIKKYIAQSTAHTFYENIEKVTSILQAEHRHVPYSLPKLECTHDLNVEDSSMSGVYPISSKGHASFGILWDVVDNPLFVSHQAWRYKGSRSFKFVIEQSILEGLEQMKRNAKNRSKV